MNRGTEKSNDDPVPRSKLSLIWTEKFFYPERRPTKPVQGRPSFIFTSLEKLTLELPCSDHGNIILPLTKKGSLQWREEGYFRPCDLISNRSSVLPRADQVSSKLEDLIHSVTWGWNFFLTRLKKFFQVRPTFTFYFGA